MLSQLQTIERSFWQHEQFTDESIKNLRHPTKKGVTAVDVSSNRPVLSARLSRLKRLPSGFRRVTGRGCMEWALQPDQLPRTAYGQGSQQGKSHILPDPLTFPYGVKELTRYDSVNQITNEQLLASIFRPRAVPIKGFQSYVPLEEDLAQWHKIRHHVLEGDEDRDYTNVEWDVSRLSLSAIHQRCEC